MRGNGKIEFQFFSATVKSSTSFVLKLRRCYVPGLESVQPSILR